jgi:hypothetical protein
MKVETRHPKCCRMSWPAGKSLESPLWTRTAFLRQLETGRDDNDTCMAPVEPQYEYSGLGRNWGVACRVLAVKRCLQPMGRFTRFPAGLVVKVDERPSQTLPSLPLFFPTTIHPRQRSQTTQYHTQDTKLPSHSNIVEKSCRRPSLSTKHPLGGVRSVRRMSPSWPRSTSISIRLSTISPLSAARKHLALHLAPEIAPENNTRDIQRSLEIEGVLLTILFLTLPLIRLAASPQLQSILISHSQVQITSLFFPFTSSHFHTEDPYPYYTSKLCSPEACIRHNAAKHDSVHWGSPDSLKVCSTDSLYEISS